MGRPRLRGGYLTAFVSDPAAIAGAIAQLADPGLRARMGDLGRAAVLQKFNWETEAEKLLAMYAALLPA